MQLKHLYNADCMWGMKNIYFSFLQKRQTKIPKKYKLNY